MVDFSEQEARSASEALLPRIDTGLCQSGHDMRARAPHATYSGVELEVLECCRHGYHSLGCPTRIMVA